MAEKISIRKMRRLRPLLLKHYGLPEPPDPKESYLERVVMAVLWQESPPARAGLAFVNVSEEFVDWNEVRVSVASDVATVLEACGLPGTKAAILKRVLSRGVEDLYSLEFERLCEKPRDVLKAWFMGIEGLPHSTAAFILYNVYEYDRALVDSEIARVIQRLGLVSEIAMEEDIEAALAEVVPAREAHAMYWALREHALKVCTTKKDFDCKACLLRKECEAAHRRLAEEEAAARAAREAAKAKAAEKAPPKPRPAAKTAGERRAAGARTKPATKKTP